MVRRGKEAGVRIKGGWGGVRKVLINIQFDWNNESRTFVFN